MSPDLSDLIVSHGAIVLRPAKLADEPLLRAWLSDPAIYKQWGRSPASDAHVREHCTVQTANGDTSWPFIIETDKREAGYIQAWRSSTGAAGLDLFIAPEYRRKGIGTRAALLLAPHLRDAYGWERITADPRIENAAGIAMWGKAGFEKTGEIVDIGDGPSVLMLFRPGAEPGKGTPWT